MSGKMVVVLLSLATLSIGVAFVGCGGSVADFANITGPDRVRVGEVVQFASSVTGGKFVVPKNGDPSLDTSSAPSTTAVVVPGAAAYYIQRGMWWYLYPYYDTNIEENAGRCVMTPGGQFTALQADLYAVAYRNEVGRLIGLKAVEAYMGADGEDVIDITDEDGNELKDFVTITIVDGAYYLYLGGNGPFTLVVNSGPIVIAEVDADAGIYLIVVQPGTSAGSYPCVVTITDGDGNTYVWHVTVVVGGSDDDDNNGVSAVVVSPTSVDVKVNMTKQFTATVYPSTANQAVTWTAIRGTVNANGLYTAPSTVGSDTVTAKSVADPSFKTTVDINVVAADTDDGGISVIIEGNGNDSKI